MALRCERAAVAEADERTEDRSEGDKKIVSEALELLGKAYEMLAEIDEDHNEDIAAEADDLSLLIGRIAKIWRNMP